VNSYENSLMTDVNAQKITIFKSHKISKRPHRRKRKKWSTQSSKNFRVSIWSESTNSKKNIHVTNSKNFKNFVEFQEVHYKYNGTFNKIPEITSSLSKNHTDCFNFLRKFNVLKDIKNFVRFRQCLEIPKNWIFQKHFVELWKSSALKVKNF